MYSRLNGFSTYPLVGHAHFRLCGTVVPLIERILLFLGPKQCAMVIGVFRCLDRDYGMEGHPYLDIVYLVLKYLFDSSSICKLYNGVLSVFNSLGLLRHRRVSAQSVSEWRNEL